MPEETASLAIFRKPLQPMSIRINVSRVVASLKLVALLYQQGKFTNQSNIMKNKTFLVLVILS